MGDKLGRRYELTIGTLDGDTITVELPFTLELDITRNTLSSANVCQCRVYNLGPERRNQIRFNTSNYGQFMPIELKAGYGENLSTIFTGNVSQAWSVREGVDWITQMECYDGGFAFVNGTTNKQFPAGTPVKAVVTDLAGSLPNVALGVVGAYDGFLKRSNSYSGNTAGIITEITGGGFFVDSGKANALKTNEYIETFSPTLIISAASGLLNTPVLEQTYVRFDTIFEPQLNVGYKVLLDSLTGLNFNGEYKILAVKHRGVISAAVSGTLITTGEFFYDKVLEGAL